MLKYNTIHFHATSRRKLPVVRMISVINSIQLLWLHSGKPGPDSNRLRDWCAFRGYPSNRRTLQILFQNLLQMAENNARAKLGVDDTCVRKLSRTALQQRHPLCKLGFRKRQWGAHGGTGKAVFKPPRLGITSALRVTNPPRRLVRGYKAPPFPLFVLTPVSASPTDGDCCQIR